MLIQKVELLDVGKIAVAIVAAFVMIELVFALTDVFLIFFTAVIIAIAIEKPIEKMKQRGISRAVSASVMYATVIISLLLLMSLALPPLATEFRSFLTSYPTYSEVLLGEGEIFQVAPYLSSLSDSIASSPGAAISTVFKTFSSFVSFMAVFFIAYFLNAQAGGLRSFIDPLVPVSKKKTVLLFIDRVQERVASWLWGKFLSSILVGVITFIGLLIIGIPYALTLAVFAFLLNFIPFVGPIIASVPAIILGAFISSFHAIAVGMLYFFVNGILESFVFGPLLMRRAVQISPALLIIFVVSGGYLGGVFGIIIAIPAAAIINLAIGEYIAHRHKVKETVSIETV